MVLTGRLGEYMQGLVGDSELPMFSSQLVELLSLPHEDPKAARRLFELVGQDYALTCKVLRIANSYHYNRSSKPIENLSRAIFVLGVNTVRNLASTLGCFEFSQERSATLRQLMARSMVSAQVASGAADITGLGPSDMAYLVGMLYNLGDVLVAHHTPLHYAAIQAHINEGDTREAASVKELAFTFDQLANVVARHWKLSPSVCDLWDPCTASADLTVLARFANELTRIMCTAARQQGGLALLTMRYGRTMGLNGDGIVDIWDRALAVTEEMFATLGVTFDLRRSADAAANPAAETTRRVVLEPPAVHKLTPLRI